MLLLGWTPRKENYEKLRKKTTFDYKLNTRLWTWKFKITRLEDLKYLEFKH